MERHTVVKVEDILTTKQVHYVLNQVAGDDWRLVGSDVVPASLGLSGFMGDHFRVKFHVKGTGSAREIHLFVKSMPLSNGPKAKFINENNYFRREMIMFELFGEMQASTDGEWLRELYRAGSVGHLMVNNVMQFTPQIESNPWCAKAYLCNDNVLVMPDLLYGGYRQLPPLDVLDLQHTLLVTASIARFHAAFANYETQRSLDGYSPFNHTYADLLKEPTFNDSPWLRAAAKLTKNFLTAFSDKCNQYPLNLEERLIELYIQACDSLTESNSLNVVNHKDLWVNNIMFKYEGESPVNALFIDFQCVRYGPPAFDLMIFLYLNTSRCFRKKYETMIFRHYYVIFLEKTDDKTKRRLQILGYDFDDFVGWCHKARMFAMLEAVGIFPYVLMEPGAAQKTFDNPETFVKYCDVDRTEPVVAHAMESAAYRQRQLEVCEEFVERYVLKQVNH